MSDAAIQRWYAAAMALVPGELKTSVPFDVFTGEAIDVSKFHNRYWKAQLDDEDEVIFPGLELSLGDKPAVQGVKISSRTGKEIKSLVSAVREADTRYLFALGPFQRAPVERARLIVSKLDSVLTWAFDDGVEDDNDTKLANVQARHRDASTTDELASAVEVYYALGHENRELLASFRTFKMKLLDEAPGVAAALRDAPATPSQQTKESRAALDLRDRLGRLLKQRVALVRGAAGFVFEDYPEILREVTSAYERRRRTASRRSKKEEGTSEPKPPV